MKNVGINFLAKKDKQVSDNIFTFIKMFENPVISLLKRCSDSYYNLGEFYILTEDDKDLIKDYPNCQYATEVNDYIYDSIYFKAKELYPTDSFFKEVGIAERGAKIKLPYKMGSMTELKEGDLEKWVDTSIDYVQTSKLDGCSAEVIYENGKLIQAFSRGDGEEGQDITRHLIQFDSLPKVIKHREKIALRGEVIVPKTDISLMIQELKTEIGKQYKNGRNTVAGQLNAKVCGQSFAKYARFVSYKIEEWNKSEFEQFEYINELGFLTPVYKLVKGSEITEPKMIEEVKYIKANDEYECDGLILTVNHMTDEYQGYDSGTINPKASRKFKIGANDNWAITTVKNIEWNISKDGYFKPRVNIEPVDILGVTISWATGHNYKNVVDNKIGQGAIIKIKRSGDVIPYIEEVLQSTVNENYGLPNNHLFYTNDVDIILTDKELPEDLLSEYYDLCQEMYLQKLVYFCEKMKVDFAGEGNIRRIIDFHSDKDVCDTYDVAHLILEPLSTFEETIGVNGTKFYNSLHDRLKNVNPAVFFDAVNAFGRGLGELKLQKIIDAYGTLNVDYGEVLNVEGFAEKSARQFIDHFEEYDNWLLFIAHQPNITLKYPESNKSNKFSYIKVVFTGIRDNLMEQIIKENGGKVLTSCTKECNLVIAKDKNSSSGKLKKAREQGIEIISYDEAQERFYD